MTVEKYLNYSFDNELYKNIKWHYTMLGKIESDNEYVKIDNKKILVNVNNNYEELTGVNIDQPIITPTTKVVIYKKNFPNIEKDSLITSYGRAIVNKILIADIFGNKINFINGRISITDLEKIIAKKMQEDIISVDELLKFSVACSFMEELDILVTISCTKKIMLPPPGIIEFKKNLEDKYNKEFGTDWKNKREYITKYMSELEKYDAEYLKDDPTNGIMLDSKMKSNSRSKLFLAFGSELGFDKSDLNAKLITRSLSEGYPNNPDDLATMFNTSRAGSYDRGKETQNAGVSAKITLRATNAITINSNHDCGSKVGKPKLVTNDNINTLIGRYMITANGIEVLTEEKLKTLIGNTIYIRSPQYCHEPNNNLCGICVGDRLKKYENGVSILVTDIGATLLTIRLKTMHNAVVKTMQFNVTDAIF